MLTHLLERITRKCCMITKTSLSMACPEYTTLYKTPEEAACDPFNTLRPIQNGRHLADDIFKCIFLNENAWIAFKISLKFIPKVWINNILTLVQIMAWHRPGDKPLSETMMVSLQMHTCITRPQWAKFWSPICPSLCLHHEAPCHQQPQF